MRRLEALADSFAKMYGALDPQSEAYQLRNPLLLRAFSPKHERSEKGLRVFKHFTAGYENSLIDLKIKCSGSSRAKVDGVTLTSQHTLIDLLHVYGQPTSAARYIVNFLRHALHDDTIVETTSLGWFLEDHDA